MDSNSTKLDWQSIVRDYLAENGIKVKKYKQYLRMPLIRGYVNILPNKGGIALVTSQMSLGYGYALKGTVEDPSNEMLKNLLALCRKCEEVNNFFDNICVIPPSGYSTPQLDG